MPGIVRRTDAYARNVRYVKGGLDELEEQLKDIKKWELIEDRTCKTIVDTAGRYWKRLKEINPREEAIFDLYQADEFHVPDEYLLNRKKQLKEFDELLDQLHDVVDRLYVIDKKDPKTPEIVEDLNKLKMELHTLSSRDRTRHKAKLKVLDKKEERVRFTYPKKQAAPMMRPQGRDHCMSWVDELPLKFDRGGGARTALELIECGYDSAKSLKKVARLAGLNVGSINFDQAPNDLLMPLLDCAAHEKRLVKLLGEILSDSSSAAIHDDLWRTLDTDAAQRVHAEAIATSTRFDRAAALPDGAEYEVNGAKGDLQKIVNAVARFQDSAMLRSELAQCEARVARIDINDIGEGSGWLVAPDIILTSYHVISKVVDDWARVKIRLDYKFVPALGGKLLAPGKAGSFGG